MKTKPKKKTLCKNGHRWVALTRQSSLWPYTIPCGRICLRCGEKRKDGIVQAN